MKNIISNFIGWITGTKQKEERRAFIEQHEAQSRKLEELVKSIASASTATTNQSVESKSEDNKYDSKEPWVEIKSADPTNVKGIRIDLDWNDAFVEHLKTNGITGKSDEEIVQKWLAHLYQDLINNMEEVIVDQRSNKTHSDYEL